MAVTVIGVQLMPTGSGTAQANWNNLENPATTGLRVADLIELDAGTSTGFTLTQNGAFANAIEGAGLATSSPDPRFDVQVFRTAWYVGLADDDAASFTVGNLPVGSTVTLEAAACSGNSSRDTTFRLVGETTVEALYDVGAIDPVPQPTFLQVTVPASGEVTAQNIGVSTFAYNNGWILTVDDGASSTPSITTADNVTSEGQTATFTLSGNENAPTGITINGEVGSNITFVSEDTGAGTETYSYEPPLIADDDTADLVVSVDGTTAGATIAYANSYDRDQLTHPATEAEYSENSLSYPNAYATTQPYEWKVIADANASVVTIDWNDLEADDGFHKDIASYATPVANGVTAVTLGVFVPETGQAYQFDRTIEVTDTSVVIGESNRLRQSLKESLRSSLNEN